MSELFVENLSVSYSGIAALRGLTLQASKSKVTALVGANGAGKSSTVRAIMGLVPSAGVVRCLGQDVGSLPTPLRARLGIGFVPEGRGIFTPLTIRENLLMGAHRLAAPARAEAIDDVIDLFPMLGDRMTDFGGALSGGQQQMLAVGRALMGRPKILILDEPSMGLSPTLCKDLFARLRLIADRGTVVLVSDQNARRVMSIADHVYVLRQGRLVLSGSPESLKTSETVTSAYFGTKPVDSNAREMEVDGEFA